MFLSSNFDASFVLFLQLMKHGHSWNPLPLYKGGGEFLKFSPKGKGSGFPYEKAWLVK